MLLGIAYLSGIADASTLVAIFSLGLVMNLLGLAMEVVNQKAEKVSWLTYKIGCIAGIVPWAIFAIYVAGAQKYGSGVPTFVYWIYLSLFVFFSSFALNMYYQYKKSGKWADYLYGERVYMILSLVAKAALAWQIFAGSLRP
jgi:Heliorhodopsin